MKSLIDSHESLAARLRREGLVAASIIAAGLPSCRDNRPRTRDAVTRWIKSGKLEGVRLPDGYYSSWAAVERMMSRDIVNTPPEPEPTPAQIRKRVEKAMAELGKGKRRR